MPQYKSTWGVQQVLPHLSELSPIEKFDLKSLTLKPVMLVALVSAQMPNFALCFIYSNTVSFMKDTSSSFEFVLPAHIKLSTPQYHPLPVILRPYIGKNFLFLRGKETQLLIFY